MVIHILDKKTLPDEALHSIIDLVIQIWPSKNGIDNIAERTKSYMKENSTHFNKVILLWEDHTVAGHAEIFDREIFSNNRKIRNMALGGVCVRPSYRGKDFGKIVVQKVFHYIDIGQFECSVFQTNIPQFYDKLGAKIIYNKFFNSQNKGNDITIPDWGPYIMVYPKEYAFDNFDIDLNGNGY
ncbi:MAG: GNAT family N-acetyltransferase [Bacteroidota bacterium]